MRVPLLRSSAVLLMALAALSVGGCFGAQAWWLDLCAHFRWQYAGSALLLGVLTVLLRAWRWSVLALLVLIGNTALLWPARPASGALDQQADGRIVLISSNLWIGNRNLDRFIQWVRAERADVLVVQELSASARERINAELDLREVIAVPASDPFGIGVWTRLPVRSAQLRELGPYAHATIHAELELEAASAEPRTLDVYAVHPMPPIGAAGTAARNAYLLELSDWVQERPRGVLAIAGDFNATPWSSALRHLLASLELQRAGAERWPQPTWKAAGLLGWLLAVPIDHVLLRDAPGADAELGPDIGSDHRPLRVRLRH